MKKSQTLLLSLTTVGSWTVISRIFGFIRDIFIATFLGSGPVKGFALTLGVGILTTLFTVYFIARLMTALYVIKNKDNEKLI